MLTTAVGWAVLSGGTGTGAQAAAMARNMTPEIARRWRVPGPGLMATERSGWVRLWDWGWQSAGAIATTRAWGWAWACW